MSVCGCGLCVYNDGGQASVVVMVVVMVVVVMVVVVMVVDV